MFASMLSAVHTQTNSLTESFIYSFIHSFIHWCLVFIKKNKNTNLNCDWTKWYGQNSMNKMVYGQNGIGQNGTDKMVQTKWYEQNSNNFLLILIQLNLIYI